MGYTSDIVERVKAFLEKQDGDAENAPRDLNDVKKIAKQLGYGEPFDREQRAINALLCQAGSSDQICLSVWCFYQDMKVNTAKAPHRMP